MPPLPSQWLSEIGLAEFAPSATADIELYAQGWAQAHAEASTDEDSFRAFIELGATEFALAELYRSSLPTRSGQMILTDLPQPPQAFPITVSHRAVADAIYKTDCGPFAEHRLKTSDELKPWDVFTFAGDMSKFELLGVSDDVNALADHKIMELMIDSLAEQYTRAGLGGRIVESGVLAAQGIVWFSKVTLLRGDDYTEARDLRFAERFSPGQALA